MNEYDRTGSTGKETTLPSYIIAAGMVVITILLIIVFAGPLNTSPDQEPPAEKQTQVQE